MKDYTINGNEVEGDTVAEASANQFVKTVAATFQLI